MASPVEIGQRIKEAEKELECQLGLVRMLKHLPQAQRCRVMTAVDGLLQADAAVPGTIEAFLRGHKA